MKYVTYIIIQQKADIMAIKLILYQEIVQKFLGNYYQILKKKPIFFLDGHCSSGNTGRGDKDCPLYEEITHINELYKHEGIIIIDDFRLFGLDKSSGKLNEDWSDINKDNILKILKTRISNVYHLDSYCAKDDRLIIHIHAIM